MLKLLEPKYVECSALYTKFVFPTLYDLFERHWFIEESVIYCIFNGIFDRSGFNRRVMGFCNKTPYISHNFVLKMEEVQLTTLVIRNSPSLCVVTLRWPRILISFGLQWLIQHMTNKRTISVQRNREKKRKCHYFREVGNTVASVSIVFLFNLYNNTARQAEEEHLYKEISFQV